MSVRKNARPAINLLTFLVLTALTLFMAWVVLGSWFPKNTLVVTSLILLFVCAPLGALWMLYDCSRIEKAPFMYFVLAFVPYAFVWYYLERVRPRKQGTAVPQ